MRVGEGGEDAAAAEVDDLGGRERRLVRPDAARDAVARDRERPGERQRRVERADDAVIEDHLGLMFDHVGLNVKDYQASRAFYETALAPLGWTVVAEWPVTRWSGSAMQSEPCSGSIEREPYGTGTHVAFTCDDRATVDAFHAAALAAGGRDNGPPGLRWYHENYYGAFILDPDGNNIEAVCHAATGLTVTTSRRTLSSPLVTTPFV